MTESTPHQAIYRRWRAQTFGEIVGQEAVVATLRNAVRTGRVSHAILFTGPRGTGKTSLARILAKALNCSNLTPDGDPCDRCSACVAIRDNAALDVVEIDAASNRGINEVKDLRERLAYAPVQLRRKVYILDEAHQITRDAWNALLKSLEEPPEFVTFMFASTHPQDFPPAILSRLQRFDVRRLTVDEIAGKLELILASDEREADAEAIRLVARLAAGGMRDAESILDQLLSSTATRVTAAMVRDLLGLADAELVSGFADALVGGDGAAGMALLDRLEERGRDLRVFLDQVVDDLRARLVAGLSGRPDAGLVRSARALAAIDPTRLGPGGLRLQLELALLEAAAGDAPASRLARSMAAPSEPPPPPPPDRAEPPTPPAAREAPRRASPAVPAKPGPPPATPSVEARPPAPNTPPGDGAPAGHGSGGDLDRLRHGWLEIVARISSNPATKPLITACRPINVEGNVVTLGFPEEKAFLKDALERRRSNLEDGIGTFLGRPVAVRCVATNLDLAPPLPDDEAAAHILAEARRIFAEDLAEVPEVT